MKYTYPKISNALTYKRIDRNTVEITDHLTDNSFTFDVESVRYMRQLTGHTHPYKIPTSFSRKDIHDILQFLNEYDLTRRSDIINVSFGTKLRTLWIPKRTVSLRLLACLSNTLLMICWLPVLITGIVMLINKFNHIEFDWLWAGYVIGLVCGMFLHELGHAFAGMSYGAHVFEMGVMVMYYILPGAYVLMDRTPVKKRLQRLQIYAAGVEVNFLSCGIFLIMGTLVPSFGGLFVSAAICNGILGIFNLTFIKGLDGTSIISELLGMEEIVACATNILFDRKERNRIIHRGILGHAVIAMCSIFLLLQIALPVLWILNILEVLACFV